MFKNETLVKWFVCSLIVVSQVSWAQSAPPATSAPSSPSYPPQSSGGDRCWSVEQSLAKAEDELAAAEGRSAPQAQIDRLKKLIEDRTKRHKKVCIDSSNQQFGCPNAQSNFSNAMNQFASSCRGLPSDASIAGNIACGHSVARCECPGQPAGSVAHSKLQCGSDSATTVPAINSDGTRNITAASAKFSVCALAAATDIDKIEKEVRELQKEVRELDKRTPELQQSIDEAQSQMREKVQQADQQMADALKQWQQQKSEIVKRQRQSARQAAEKARTIQDSIIQIDNELSESRSSRKDAENARTEQADRIKGDCHKEAITKVNAMQLQRLEAERGRSYNRGGFNQMLRNVGLTDRKMWQVKAKEYHQDCMQSDLVRDAIKNTNKRYYALLDRANEKDNTIRARRKAAVEQVLKIQNGCNMTGNGFSASGEILDAETCQAVRESLEDGAKADADYQVQQRLNETNKANAQNDGRARIQAKRNELRKATQLVDEERTRLNNLRRFLALKQEKAPGGNIDAKDASDINGKHGSMVGFASELVQCHSPSKCAENAACKKAAEYLIAIGRPTMYASESADSDSSTGATTTLPPGSAPPATPPSSGGSTTAPRN